MIFIPICLALCANSNYYHLYNVYGVNQMYVCMCYGVTDKAIIQAVEKHGAGNLRELREVMDIGSQCGKCISMAQQVIDSTIIDESLFREVS